MRYYRSGAKKQSRRRDRRSWSSSKFGSARGNRVRHYEEAAFLGNPSLYKHGRAKPLHLKGLILGITLLAWFGFLIYSPYFKITNTEYSGYKIVSLDQVREIVMKHVNSNSSIFPRNQYILVNTETIEKDLLASLPLESAEVKKTFPNRLAVTVTEKNSSIIFDNGESYYLLDNDGKLLKYLKQVTYTEIKSTTSTDVSSTEKISFHEPTGKEFASEYPNLPMYFENKNQVVEKDDANIIPSVISSIIDFDRGIRQGNEVRIKYFMADLNDTDINALTDRGWQIKFTADRPIEPQLIAFRSIFKVSSPVEYIDVRLEDRLFWK